MGAGGDGERGEARVVDVVMDDEAVAHPDAAIGDALPEAVLAEEGVQLALPNASGVAAAGHVTDDEEDTAATGVVSLGVAVVGEPRGDDRVEEATALREGYGRAVEVGAADVDGGLVRLEDGARLVMRRLVIPSVQQEKVSMETVEST